MKLASRGTVVAMALLCGFQLVAARAEPPATAPATAPATVKVRRGELKLLIETTGTFEPAEPFEVRIRPKAYHGELIVAAAVASGAQVAKGDVILEIDSTSLKRQLATAENEQQTARANLEKAQADVTQGEAADQLALRMQETEAKNAVGGLRWWDQVDGKHMLLNAEVSLKNANDQVGDQEDELDQLRKMYKSEELTNATADIVVKRALRQLERAKIMRGIAEERLEKVKNNDHANAREKVAFAVEQHAQALERLKTAQAQAGAHREAAVASAKIALEAADEKLAHLKHDLEQFTARAPESMTVLYGNLVNGAWQNNNPRSLRVGDKVPPHQTVMIAFVPGKLRVAADIQESKLLWFAPGTKATVTPSAIAQTAMTGTCGAPPPSVVHGAQSFAVPIELRQIDPRIAPGMKATVTIDAGRSEPVLLVPNSAVKDRKVWMRQPDGSEKAVEITIGRQDAEFTEVTAGLSEGDEVLKDAKK
jgi:multidrug efflux pump subunit AcrA (membrane-fusion protein)